MVGAESQQAGSRSVLSTTTPGSPLSLSPHGRDRGDSTHQTVVGVCAAPGRGLQLIGGAATSAVNKEGVGKNGLL